MGVVSCLSLLSAPIYVQVLAIEEITNSNGQGMVPLLEDYDGVLLRILMESERSPYRSTSCSQTSILHITDVEHKQ
jgi:hypothetical protein